MVRKRYRSSSFVNVEISKLSLFHHFIHYFHFAKSVTVELILCCRSRVRFTWKLRSVIHIKSQYFVLIQGLIGRNRFQKKVSNFLGKPIAFERTRCFLERFLALVVVLTFTSIWRQFLLYLTILFVSYMHVRLCEHIDSHL